MKDKSTARVVKYFLKKAFHDKRLYLCLFLLPFAALCIGTGLPMITSRILANLAQQNGNFDWHPFMVQFIAVAIVGALCNRFGYRILHVSQALAMDRIHRDTLNSLLDKSSGFYANRMSGKIISDGIEIDSAFTQFMDLTFAMGMGFVTTLVSGIVIVGLASPLLGLGLLVTTSVVFGMAYRSTSRRKHFRETRREAARNVRGNFADIITNNQNVKVFAQENFERQTHNKLMQTLYKARHDDWVDMANKGNNRIVGLLILEAAFIVLTIIAVQHNPAILASGIFAFGFTITLMNRMFDITSMLRAFESVVTDAGPMIEIMDLKPEVVDAPDATELEVSSGAIAFENVDFNYQESQANSSLFKNLSLQIKPGEKVGLVGHSGGGKTTITKLILRLIDIQGGAILIDDQNIAEVTQQSLRRAISYVPQEPLLFHRTIAQNIAYGRPNASHKEVVATARKAFAHDFINSLPYGYDTLVGERGVKLSGGQRQRVAIARSILKDSPILVLDEATSALDSESEVLIQKALWKLMEGRTTIVIAHRLSTIQKMDRIIVMDNGKIIEEGSHNELLAAKGKYAELWAHQSGGFIEE